MASLAELLAPESKASPEQGTERLREEAAHAEANAAPTAAPAPVCIEHASNHRPAPAQAEPRSEAAANACPCGCNSEEALGQFDQMPDEELLYDLADLFKVFSDTTRIKILYSLMGSERAVGDIAEIIGATQSAVSHQLRTLKQAHLVKFRRDGKSVLYSLADDHVFTMLAQGMTHICE